MTSPGRFRRFDDRVVGWTNARFGSGPVARLAAPALGGLSALLVLVLALVLAGKTDRLVILVGPAVGVVLTLALFFTVGANERRRKR